MIRQSYSLIVPHHVGDTEYPQCAYNLLAQQPDSRIIDYHGTVYVHKLRIEAVNAEVEGKINGKLSSFDYRSIYDVYNLDHSDGYEQWISEFKKDSNQDGLRIANAGSSQIQAAIDIKFTIKPLVDRIASIAIGFETLRLQVNGTVKDYIISNPRSGSGMGSNGNRYPVAFEPV